MLCGLALIVAFIISLANGRHGFDLLFVLEGRDGKLTEALEILRYSRLPRSLAAVLVGACLSIAGAAFQALFRNPLVSPDMLGASAGSALGAALGILLGYGVFGVETLAFVLGIGAVSGTWLVATSVSRERSPLVLILSGILVSTVFTSLLSLVKFLADPYSKLPDITFWLLGSLSAINLDEVLLLAVCAAVGIAPLLYLRWRLNVLSLNEEEARALGINTGMLRLVVIASATLATSAAVSICGLIGWVGLLVPHASRLIFGPDYATLLIASIVIGAIFLLLVDTFARSAMSLEVPLGIPIALFGAPGFFLLLRRAERGWG
jgi:iron complex transport system permease protein